MWSPSEGGPRSLLGPNALQSLMNTAAECPPGCFVEFGVYQGGSAFQLARVAEAQGRELYLYDTFEGIPFHSEFDTHHVGDFSDVDYEAVRKAIPSAKFVKGIFPASLVPMPPIAFAHVDADQYQSLKDAIAVLGPLMVSGGAMMFDDPMCIAGALKALVESGLEYTLGPEEKPVVRF